MIHIKSLCMLLLIVVSAVYGMVGYPPRTQTEEDIKQNSVNSSYIVQFQNTTEWGYIESSQYNITLKFGGYVINNYTTPDFFLGYAYDVPKENGTASVIYLQSDPNVLLVENNSIVTIQSTGVEAYY
ncbi:hypothetical protein MP228_012818 [Amoeboaphelidium protococcarum]|nr:hypothetical protein MP228_012818 [Amoeboaphelidium protococcarum]